MNDRDRRAARARRGGSRKTSRREFVRGAAAAMATISIVPRHVLGGAGFVPPSEKLNLAGVGLGGMGYGNLDRGLSSQNILALCDVDSKYGARAFKRFPEARRYKDYREMLDKEKDIDGVMVATPDHMHATISLAAIKAGKHVYCEKPLTHTLYEARTLAEAARERGVATQMGNRGQATEGPRRVCEWIWDGAIGPVREVHAWTDRPRNGIYKEYWPQGVDRPKETPPVPETLDWKLWLGVAPERPYNPAYHPFKWRGWWDFGTGALGDIGCHTLDCVVRALKLGHADSVEASSSPVNEETYPVASIVTWQFPARGDQPPVRLMWYDGGLRPPRPVELEPGETLGSYTNGVLYIGEKGKIMTSGSSGRPILLPRSRMNDYKRPPQSLPPSPGHYEEWIAAAKGGKPAGSNFDHAGPLTETVLLGNVALRRSLREKLAKGALLWDGPNLRFTNIPEANEYVGKDAAEKIF